MRIMKMTALLMLLGSAVFAEEAAPAGEKTKDQPERITFEGGKILKGESKSFRFKQADNDTRQIRFVMEARIDWSSLGGYTGAMTISVNGAKLIGRRLLNKPLTFRTRSGGTGYWGGRDSAGYVLMYSPDFSDKIKTNEQYIYGLYEENQEPYRFVFDLTGLTQHVGENEVRVGATWLPIAVDNVYVEFDRTFLPRINDYEDAAPAPAPQGPLPDFTPRSIAPADLSLGTAQSASFLLKAGPYQLPVRTRLSLPGGKWLTEPKPGETPAEQLWETPEYTMTRTIRTEKNRILVTDRFQNKKDTAAGVILENRFTLPEKPKRFLTSGRELILSTFGVSHGNPTLTSELEKGVFSVVLEDDVLRAHTKAWRKDAEFLFADRVLAIPPGGTQTLEWSIYYADNADYFDIINEIRKDWKVNFTLKGPFSFPYGAGTGGISAQYWPQRDASPEKVKDFLEKRKAKIIITHVPGNYSVAKDTRERPRLGHGTALTDSGFAGWRNQTRSMTDAFRKYAPDVQVHAYLHKNLCTEQDNRGKYNDALPLPGGTYDKLMKTGVDSYYVPSLNNSYGKKLLETVRFILDDLKTNIYMDEICLGVLEVGKYTEWDNCTARIDPFTHELKELVSCPNLLERPWMSVMLQELGKRKRGLIGNAPPATRELRDFKAVFFSEECMGEGGLYSMHLSTPLGFCYKLGKGGYKHFKKCIEAGNICFNSSGDFSVKSFPLTPVEVRKGYIIAKERIITGVSGTFGWNDAGEADVFLYDGNGESVDSSSMVTKEKTASGNTVYHVRMPGDYLAILVKK